MKKGIIILTLATIFGCTTNIGTEKLNERSTGKTLNGWELRIFQLDSCEYLIAGAGQTQMMAHKGNCKFCAERNKK